MNWTYSLKELALAVKAKSPDKSVTFKNVSTDTRTLKPGDVFFALQGENFDGNKFVTDAFEKGACAVVASEACKDGPCITVLDPLRALQRFAAHHRARHSIPMIAITGSCGKTTAKDMAAALLSTKHKVVKTQGNLNNEIGCPLSLLKIENDTNIAVIEMGANHAGEIASLCELAKPTESAITMIASAHLEGFGCIENVAKAKGEIVEALPASGTLYVNTSDPFCVKIADSFAGNKTTFGADGDVALRACSFDNEGQMLLGIDPIGELSLPIYSKALVTNVLLAIAIGLNHGVNDFQSPLQEACLESTRFKLMKIGPVEVIDDTYNANPTSMAAALDTLAQRPSKSARIAVLGEMLELGAASRDLHIELGERAAKSGVTHLFVKGPNARHVVEAAKSAGVEHALDIDDHKTIANEVFAIANDGDVLLAKGSRGMRIELVLEELRKLYSNDSD